LAWVHQPQWFIIYHNMFVILPSGLWQVKLLGEMKGEGKF
jgi:hypothetical protein